ncbi:putative phosphomutase (TIGR03848 family) [Kineococcus radiotolerans]|uniref:Putative phosphomutase (TIGR03848 family) n=1 Tax=Kineococcus radiotolerans TaxID=131568 RepID=A0A7W4TJD9_KINRA|nr:histidine phosphatase family protein [Kineococcus radiotolerans]MBB2899562.1 putative phosphomutase (TIGR03848 family) [Kineococcus radiotolerans]
MPTLLLVRHGRSTANTAGVLAGWTPDVHLDDTGRAQAAALGQRLAPVPVASFVVSPLERCQETAAALRAVDGPDGPRPAATTDERLGECRYGDWTGRPIKELAREPLWRTVQEHPSAAVFPGPDGEGLADVQHRSVAAVREHDARVAAEHGEDAVWVAVTHGDVIKAILADALGMHLDLFQRISADPCSVSVVRYAPLRPFVLRVNDSGGDLSGFAPRRKRARRSSARPARRSSDAVVGGGAGSA